MFLSHYHKEKQSTRATIRWVSDSGLGCTCLITFLCFTEHDSVGSLWPQRPIITLSGSRQTAKLPCISVDQKTQGPRYSPSSHLSFLCPQSFTPEERIRTKACMCTNSCNTPLGNWEFYYMVLVGGGFFFQFKNFSN